MISSTQTQKGRVLFLEGNFSAGYYLGETLMIRYPGVRVGWDYSPPTWCPFATDENEKETMSFLRQVYRKSFVC